MAGDQLARVALTLLVYERTHSALLAAITYVASVVPEFLGGVLLAGLADRWPRRDLMIACDLTRAVLVTVMALPAVPVVGLVGLLFAVTLVGAPFSAARAALYPDILTGDTYVLGTAITFTTAQAAQVAGFALGGVVVGIVGVHTSLAADALTFLLSAALTIVWVRRRPAAAQGTGHTGFSLAGLRLVLGAAALRTPMLLGWLAAFTDVYEGVAVPLARELGGGAAASGVILASGALGTSVGAVAFSRLAGPRTRIRWMSPLAVAACALLGLFAFRPALAGALLILTASGGFCCYQLAANAAFVTAAPVEQAKPGVRCRAGRDHARPGHRHDPGRCRGRLAAACHRDSGHWRAGSARRGGHRQDQPREAAHWLLMPILAGEDRHWPENARPGKPGRAIPTAAVLVPRPSFSRVTPSLHPACSPGTRQASPAGPHPSLPC